MIAQQDFQPDHSVSILEKWWEPFLWIMLSPAITIPLTLLLFPGGHEAAEVGLPREGDWVNEYEYFDPVPVIAAFVLPGLVNLVPLIWIAAGERRVRSAGIVAGILGLVRVVIAPLVLIIGFNIMTGSDGKSYFQFAVDGFVIGWPPFTEVWFFEALAWLAAVVALVVFGRRTRLPVLAPER